MDTTDRPPDAAGGGDTLIDADVHVESFRQARAARRLERVEDYVELIDDLITCSGEARQVEIAARLGVAQPTVAKMLKRLADEGLRVTAALSRRLPDRERQGAGRTRARAPQTSWRRSCERSASARKRRAATPEGIEHHVSDETLDAFRRFAAS